MDDSRGSVDELQFLFGSKFELEDTLSDFRTSIESIDGEGFDDVVSNDDLDIVMFCLRILHLMKVRMT